MHHRPRDLEHAASERAVALHHASATSGADTPPPSVDAERTPEGLLVTVETSALERIARFVVRFAGAVVVHTEELRAAVRALAEGALARCADPVPT